MFTPVDYQYDLTPVLYIFTAKLELFFDLSETSTIQRSILAHLSHGPCWCWNKLLVHYGSTDAGTCILIGQALPSLVHTVVSRIPRVHWMDAVDVLLKMCVQYFPSPPELIFSTPSSRSPPITFPGPGLVSLSWFCLTHCHCLQALAYITWNMITLFWYIPSVRHTLRIWF